MELALRLGHICEMLGNHYGISRIRFNLIQCNHRNETSIGNQGDEDNSHEIHWQSYYVIIHHYYITKGVCSKKIVSRHNMTESTLKCYFNNYSMVNRQALFWWLQCGQINLKVLFQKLQSDQINPRRCYFNDYNVIESALKYYLNDNNMDESALIKCHFDDSKALSDKNYMV